MDTCSLKNNGECKPTQLVLFPQLKASAVKKIKNSVK